MDPPGKRPNESEVELRDRVREAITEHMPPDERQQMKEDKRIEYKQINGNTESGDYDEIES